MGYEEARVTAGPAWEQWETFVASLSPEQALDGAGTLADVALNAAIAGQVVARPGGGDRALPLVLTLLQRAAEGGCDQSREGEVRDAAARLLARGSDVARAFQS